MKKKMPRGRSKVHTLTVTVRMNRPCTATFALREVRDCIHGDFYPTQREDRDPDLMRVKFNRAKAVRQ